MKKSNIYKTSIIFAIILCFIFISPIKSYATDTAKETSSFITPHMLKEWDDGAKVKKKVKGSGKNYTLSVTADTTGLSEGYYSVYYYDYGQRNIASYDGIQYHFSNPNAFELKINTTFTISKNKSVSLVDGSYVILTSDDKTVNKVEKTIYGTITIPSGFTGMVYLPFSQLHTSKGGEIALKSIMSWGITTVMAQEEQANYEISQIAFLHNSVANKKASYLVYSIDGISNINIPSVGSTLEAYQVSATDMLGNAVTDEIDFFLPESISGVSISADGKLEIQNNCVATSIVIGAKTKNSTNAGTFTITLNHLTAAAAKAGVPNAVDVPSIASAKIDFAVKWIVWIRVGAALILLAIAGILFSWMLVARAHYKEMKAKFYDSLKRTEEEKKS